MAKRRTTKRQAAPAVAAVANPKVMMAVYHLNHGRYEEAIRSVRSVDETLAEDLQGRLDGIRDAIMELGA